MASVCQRFLEALRKAGFTHEFIRKPLVMYAWLSNRFLRAEPQIKHVYQLQSHLRNDLRTTRGPNRDDRLPILKHDRGAHAGKRALARRYRIGFGADQPKEIRRSRLD